MQLDSFYCQNLAAITSLLYRFNPSLAEHDMPCLSKHVDPDEFASWSGSALFVIKYVNFYQNPDQVIWLAGN